MNGKICKQNIKFWVRGLSCNFINTNRQQKLLKIDTVTETIDYMMKMKLKQWENMQFKTKEY